MTWFTNYLREARFLFKQKYLLVLFSAVFGLSVFAVWTGLVESSNQSATIERLLDKDATDRASVQAKQKDYGSAAYYTFHLTYSEPSSLAFAAMGQRDVAPWKHRVRMLALEGQIYETDSDNPELSFLGRFDFSFLVSVLLPIFVILLLHDLRSNEREAGRYDLITATAGKHQKIWFSRAIVLCSALLAALLVPFVIGSVIAQANLVDVISMMAVVTLHLVFWAAIVLIYTASKTAIKQSSAQIASILLSAWLVTTVLIPVGSDLIIDEWVESPNGGEIVLTQREAVNDAWDLPFSATWEPFLETHPEYADKTKMKPFFEWKWYYAFQQVGDQKASDLSLAYRRATKQKDRLASRFALLSPPMLTQRALTALAKTDTAAAIKYEQTIRDYHKSLREFYYPLMFDEVPFSLKTLEQVPDFAEFVRTEEQSKK